MVAGGVRNVNELENVTVAKAKLADIDGAMASVGGFVGMDPAAPVDFTPIAEVDGPISSRISSATSTSAPSSSTSRRTTRCPASSTADVRR
jgi:hypothetical protein